MNYQGQCECGTTTFECYGEPFFTQYCHCNKCREVASLSPRLQDKIGYSFTAAYLTKNFHLTSDIKLKEEIRNNATLFLCPECNTLIYGISLDPNLQSGIGINANNFIFNSALPKSFNPVRHIWYQNHIIDIQDNLPKFKDAPKDQFGSGELF